MKTGCRFVLALSLLSLFIASCAEVNSQTKVSQEFESNYKAWRAEIHESNHSDTPWYTSRPSFRNIIALGPAVIPLLKEKLEEDQKQEIGDFFLAFAVVEIKGWDTAEFYEDVKVLGEQGFRDNVLKKLNQEYTESGSRG